MGSDSRPQVSAGLLGATLVALPPRLRRRLDAEPEIAESWDWRVSDGEVTVTHEDATVTVRPESGLVGSSAQVSCSCLLAPACLHLSAVLLRLEVSSEVPVSAEAEPKAEGARKRATGPATESMINAAALMSAAVGRILEVGASSAGVVATGEVLRAVHSCQVAGLHRCASAGLRVARNLSRLRADEPEFRLRDLRNDIADALATSRRLARGESGAEVIGTARRAYEAVGALRLYGLFTEPIISRSGYAGCVTYMVDRERRIWALSDVMPGDASRAAQAYGGPAGIGDVSLTHRESSRAGVHIGEARASEDRRLGRGQQVRAVRAAGIAWTEDPINALFSPPLADQLSRAWAGYELPDTIRPQGETFVFLEAKVLGERRGQLVIMVDGLPLACIAAIDNPEASYRDNLRVLSEAPGLGLRVVGRPLLDTPSTIELLAVGVAAEGGLDLPANWAGRVNIGLDSLTRSQVHAGAAPAVTPRGHSVPDVLDPLARRLERVVVGGRLTMGEAARPSIDREVAVLRRRHLPTAAAVLGDLAARSASRAPSAEVAECWLAAAVYEATAQRRLAVRRWISG